MQATAQQELLIRAALAQARLAAVSGDVPVGAVVADPSGRIIARARNEREALHDPSAHAEVLALRRASAVLGSWRLAGCTLAVTLEPCAMCAGAVLAARVPRLVYGAWDAKAGAAGSVYDLIRDGRLPGRAEVVAGVLAQECARPLIEFFRGGEDEEASPRV